MKVFVTGATGFIGSAIVQELIGAGHKVLGLSRSDAGEKLLRGFGADVQRGSLEDLESLKSGAKQTDGTIHCAFIHDFMSSGGNFAASCAADEAAINAMGSVLEGSNKPFIATSGLLGLAQGRAGTEDDTPSEAFPRKSESASLALVSKGVRAMVMRLSPSVHGDGDHGFVPQLIKTAREKGFSAYVGDGQNRWPAVHRLDTAKLYRLGLEKGEAGGRYHGVAEEGIAFKEIAETIGKHLKVPAVSKKADEASALLGFIGMVAGMDATASNKKTSEKLGWKPTHVGLIEDLEKGTYFESDK
jgi:nucleoside-diphosphate-sugar epimerase